MCTLNKGMEPMAVLVPPTKVRICPTCGDEMVWLPMVDRFGLLYRWRAWCRECLSHAKRKNG